MKMSSNENSVKLFIDAIKKYDESYSYGFIPGGGTLTVGQEQDNENVTISNKHQAFRQVVCKEFCKECKELMSAV